MVYTRIMEFGREIVLATESGTKHFRVHPPAKWRVFHTPISNLLQQTRLAAITIIEPPASADSSRLRSLAAALARKGFTKKAGSHFIVWVTRRAGRQRNLDLALFRPFADPGRVEIARNQDDIGAVLRLLAAKCEVLAERTGTPRLLTPNWRDPTGEARATPSAPKRASSPRPSALEQVHAIIAATKDLRTPGGNLSAAAVAKLFGVSLSRLAKWLGRTRQAVSKAPDAASLQGELSHFERIARLRAVLGNSNDFRKWLRMANQQLDGRTPLQMLDEGRWQVVADLVDDMLTGSPT